MKRVAIQGVEGAYHEIAARAYFKARGEEEVEILPRARFKDVIAAAQEDAGITGIMAIENTIAGSLLQNHELIRVSGLVVVGEQKTRVTHTLAALPGDRLESIAEVHSHPIALMQCADYLEAMPGVKVVEEEDTALSARLIAQRGMRGHAAICSRLAAGLHGLEVLDEGIETNKRNFTRFLLLSNAEAARDEEAITKSSVVFTLPHAEGSLSRVLTIFSFYGLNLTKIQSLPIIGREWEYLFYVDLTFNDPLKYRQGVEAARPLTRDFNILGEYAEYQHHDERE
ncbi:MAG: prephenate dehydratase [Odoribacteraceae bacterium]|jgi:prephenate dehydratase|nr:prephenate dehydratase [Odoribacteraceae bacterium]